jgi:hypothetical protein
MYEGALCAVKAGYAHHRLPPRTSQKVTLMTTTILISGLNHAACTSLRPASHNQLLTIHADFTTDPLARLRSDGT